MTDNTDDPETKCLTCLAEQISGTILSDFTKERPEVVMSYDAWMMLGVIIEEAVKDALSGVVEADEPAEGVMVQ